jgi:hypothetical protein
MYGNNRNRTEGLNPYWEVLDLRGDLLIVKTYLQADEDSDAIYAVVEEYKGRYFVKGVGVTYYDALRDARERAYELNDKKILENLEMFFRSF